MKKSIKKILTIFTVFALVFNLTCFTAEAKPSTGSFHSSSSSRSSSMSRPSTRSFSSSSSRPSSSISRPSSPSRPSSSASKPSSMPKSSPSTSSSKPSSSSSSSSKTAPSTSTSNSGKKTTNIIAPIIGNGNTTNSGTNKATDNTQNPEEKSNVKEEQPKGQNKSSNMFWTILKWIGIGLAAIIIIMVIISIFV